MTALSSDVSSISPQWVNSRVLLEVLKCCVLRSPSLIKQVGVQSFGHPSHGLTLKLRSDKVRTFRAFSPASGRGMIHAIASFPMALLLFQSWDWMIRLSLPW